MSFITGKHLPRRTFLRGLGATVALPFLDAMVPARGLFAGTADGRVARPHAPGLHRDGARPRPAATRGAPSSTCGRRRRPGATSTSAPTSLSPLEPLPQAPDHRQRHRRAQRRSVHAARNRRRPLPLERGVPDPGASEADAGLGRLGRHLARPALRAEVRPGHADAVDAVLHRERRPGRRLRLRLLVRLHRLDQLGVADRAAADDPRPARGVRPAVRRGRLARGARRAPPAPAQHPRLHHRPGRRSASARSTPSDRQRMDQYLDNVREIERRIQRVEARNTSGEARELPGAPAGVPDSFDEHVKLMFDLQVLAFQADMTRVFSFKTGRDAPSRVYPGERRVEGLPPGVAPRQQAGERHRVQQDQQVPRQPAAVLPRQAEGDRRKATQTLLDKTLIIYGSPMGDGNVHNHNRCPLVAARRRATACCRATCTQAPRPARRWPTCC